MDKLNTSRKISVLVLKYLVCLKKNSHQTTCYCEKYFTPKLIATLGVMQMVTESQTFKEKKNCYRRETLYCYMYICIYIYVYRSSSSSCSSSSSSI